MNAQEPLRRDLGGLWIALLACGLYLWFGQRQPYGDAIGILMLIEGGAALHNTKHFLYAPLVEALAGLFADFGLSPYRAGLVLSATGAGLGVGLSYAASRCYGMSPRRALGAAALVGACPSVMFFATTFEYHGLFFGFAMAALLCLTRLLARPTSGRAALCGLATGATWFVHESGALLPFWAALFLLLHARERGHSWMRVLWAALLVLLCHHALTHGLSGLLRHLDLAAVDPGAGPTLVQQHWQDHPRSLNGFASVTVVWEWLLPFLPLSVVALLGTLALAPPAAAAAAATTTGRGRHGAARAPGLALALALHAGVLAALLVTSVIVAVDDEFGAYLLPFAWPAAWLTARWLPPSAVLAAIGIGLIIGGTKIATTDAPRASAGRAAELRRLAGDRPLTLLVADRADVGWSFVEFPGAERLHFDRIAFLNAAQVQAGIEPFAAHLRKRIEGGRLAFLPHASRELLRRADARAISSGVAAFEQELLARFELLPRGSQDVAAGSTGTQGPAAGGGHVPGGDAGAGASGDAGAGAGAAPGAAAARRGSHPAPLGYELRWKRPR